MTTSRPTGGAQGGRLLIAAGIFTLVNNYLPGSGHLDLAVLNTVGVAAVVLGLLCLRVPWERLPPRAPLALAPVAFALLSVSNMYGGVSDFSYAVYFVVVFVWVGIAQPPGTSWLLMPLAVVAYLLPFVVGEDPPPTAVPSVTVAIPVCVLVGEVLSRSVRRLEQSRSALRRRVQLVERLAELATGLSADLDAATVQQQLCRGAVELVGARGALLVAVDGDQPAAVLAGSGEVPSTGELAADSRALRTAGDHEPAQVLPASAVGLDDAGSVVVLPVGSGAGRRLLVVLLEGDADAALDAEDLDVLRLLVAQAGTALANAERHGDVVRQRQHEQAVVDVLADGVLVLDRDGRVLACNEMAAALLGVERSALLGTVPELSLGDEGVPVHAQAGGRSLETVATWLDTTERVVTLRDISRQRALDEAKDLFLATTSHELRTPLTAVKGYVHVLQRRWEVLDDDRRREALSTIAERTEALIALTDHLLLGARASASRHSAARVPFDLAAAVATTAASYADLSRQHQLRVDVQGPLEVLGDPASVTHIVGQLVENAVKYSPRGGTVEVCVRGADDLAVVEVSDEGIGLPADEMALFAPFVQADATNTREFGGVGLGLYIVRQLVEAQGGAVLARNRQPRGAVVGFTVPLAHVEQPVTGPPDDER